MTAIRTRERALDILNACEARGAFASQMLSKAANDEDINFRLLQKLVKGSIQWKLRIDRSISTFIKQDFTSLPLPFRNLLRLAAYQYLFLPKVRKDLVVKESLALSSRIEGQDYSYKMRQALQLLDKLQYEDPVSEREGVSAESISAQYSHPLWIVERWIKNFGIDQAIAICQANNQTWPLCLRTNTLRISPYQLSKRLLAEGVSTVPGSYLEECLIVQRLPKSKRISELDSYERGLFQVQDEGAALVAHLLAPRQSDFVVDLCAAPGGKATHLATLMRNRGRVLAVDQDKTRLRLVDQNARRLGLRNIKTQVADASKIILPQEANCILIDAPCTGSGVMGRKGDIRWSREFSDINNLTQIQSLILQHSACLVKIGGKIIYSTCSIEPEENQEIIQKFLQDHSNFELQMSSISLANGVLNASGFLYTYPHQHKVGGGFAAVLKRKS